MPIPPRQIKPLPVIDLKADTTADTLTLNWTVPAGDKSGTPDIVGFIIVRSKTLTIESGCTNCPKKFQRVADIPVKPRSTKNGTLPSLTYQEQLEKGFTYIYKVIGYTARKVMSNDSNLMGITY